MFRKIILSALSLVVFFSTYSQHSIKFIHPDNLFHEGKELLNSENSQRRIDV